MSALIDSGVNEWTDGTVIEEKYVLMECLGGDGVTSRYRAQRAGNGELRVITTLSDELATDPVMFREFKEVSDLIRRVSHPNLPAVEASGDVEGRPLFVTALTEGPTLESLLQTEGKFAPVRACAIARQIVAALEATHRLGLLHLGLEPGQIIVIGKPGDERVIVEGFGMARVRMSYARSTQSRLLRPAAPLDLQALMPAAPAYAAPEMALAKSPDRLDGRADLYSLGALMYEMLMGRRPGDSSTPDEPLDELVAQVEGEPAEMDAGVPEPLARIVRQLLERRRELRPSTAKVTRESLARAAGQLGPAFASGRPAPVRPLPAPAAPGIEPPPAPPAPPIIAEPVEPQRAVADSIPAAPDPGTVALVDTSLPSPPLTEPAPPVVTAPASGMTTPPPTAETVPVLDAVPELAEKHVDGFANVPLEAQRPLEPLEPIILRPGGRIVGEMRAASGPVAPPLLPEPVYARLGNSTSVLFKTQTPPKPPVGWGRKAAAVFVVVLFIGGALFFIGQSHKLHWDSLTPTTVDQEHSLSRPDANAEVAAPPTKPAPDQSAPESALSAPQPQQVGPPVSTPSGTASANQTPPASVPERAAENVAKPAAESASKTGSDRGDTEAGAGEVTRAISAGDVFYQTGQYDLAIQTYEGPLKDHPTNPTLRNRIERAKKAKAAEQEYLGP